jgi:hypothetical protein
MANGFSKDGTTKQLQLGAWRTQALPVTDNRVTASVATSGQSGPASSTKVVNATLTASNPRRSRESRQLCHRCARGAAPGRNSVHGGRGACHSTRRARQNRQKKRALCFIARARFQHMSQSRRHSPNRFTRHGALSKHPLRQRRKLHRHGFQRMSQDGFGLAAGRNVDQ